MSPALIQLLSSMVGIQMDPTFPSAKSLEGWPLPFSQHLHLVLLTVYLGYMLTYYIKGDIALKTGSVLSVLLLAVSIGVLQWTGHSLVTNLVSCVGIVLHWNSLQSPLLPSKDKAVLVTGCDRGIGHELVKALDGLGYEVFAGCLYKGQEGEQALVSSCSSRVHTVQLDVSKTDQINTAAEEVQAKLGDKKLWAAVNNAGICYIGNVEIMTEKDMERIMAINFFGPLNIIKAFLPLMRKSRGRIVNIASNAGLAPVPLMGVYCASKAALASLTEVLRYEMRIWGMSVSTIIPSGYRTGIMVYNYTETATRWWNSANTAVKEDYGKDCFAPRFKYEDHRSKTSPDLTPIVNKIIHAISAKHPQAFYYSGILARSLPFLYSHLPTLLGDQAMKVMGDWFIFKPNALKSN